MQGWVKLMQEEKVNWNTERNLKFSYQDQLSLLKPNQMQGVKRAFLNEKYKW